MDQITTVPEQRGAGGKLRKPLPRKPPSTPYARPSSNRRWISKLVNPAYRIIADGATRFLPSFFSTPDSVENQDKQGTGEQHNEDFLLKTNLHLPPSELSKMASIGGESSKPNRLSDIEQLVKGTKFTRDEFNRIVEILNSRAIDVLNVEQGKGHTNLTSRQDDGGVVAARKLPKVFNERKHEESNAAIHGSSTPCMSKVCEHCMYLFEPFTFTNSSDKHFAKCAIFLGLNCVLNLLDINQSFKIKAVIVGNHCAVKLDSSGNNFN